MTLRRTALKRGTKPLKRTELKRGTSQLRAKKLPPEEVARRRKVKAAVFARDDCRCVLRDRLPGRPCFGGLTVHHVWKEGQGGPYERTNLVTLCGGHNAGWVEDEPDRAWALGLVKRNGDTLGECWARMRAAGLVSYAA